MSAAPESPTARLREFVIGRIGTRRLEVETAGPDEEIAVIRVPPEALDRLLAPGTREAVVERARAEGFRFAALDLGLLSPPATPESPGRAGLA